VESLKQMASCIGLSGNISILRDFFGYITGAPKDLSLLTQIGLLKGPHVHMNLIRVGSDQFTNADEQEIDAAVQFTRDTYATVGLGIGRVQRFFITTADANGRDNIDNDAEAEALTDEWTVPNDAMDIFFVLTYTGTTIGLSRVDGSCDKDAKGMDGSVVAIEGGFAVTGFVLAHEAGHYLGLSHAAVANTANLMNPTVPNGGNLTAAQGTNMRDHCFVRPAC
jgi:hypothetical protein